MHSHLMQCAKSFPAIAIVGPRQSGKSSLVRMAFPKHQIVVLESPDIAAAARNDPRGFLASFKAGTGAILDEVQRVPELLSYLLEIIDDNPVPGRWILTGSESFLLSEKVSQSLAGRVAMLELLPMTHAEIALFPGKKSAAKKSLNTAIFAGGYPAIFARKIDPTLWISAYLATYVERDVRNVLRLGDLSTFQRFLGLCAGRTSQLINASALAGDAGISQPTAKAWLSVLEATFIVKLLPAWHGNVRKRIVKAQKLHFIDTGLACHLLGIRSADQLQTHPLRGALFESWTVSEIMKLQASTGERGQLFHWRDQNGAEVDLVIARGDMMVAIEMKSGMTFHSEWLRGLNRFAAAQPAQSTLRRAVVYGGNAPWIGDSAEGVSWSDLKLFADRIFKVGAQIKILKKTRA